MQATVRSLLALVVLLGSPHLSADPRFWSHDAAIAPPGADRAWPHVSRTLGPQGEIFLVVWSELDTADGDRELWLTGTPNHGCTWCAPVRLTRNVANETRPRVAAASDGLTITVQIVAERNGDIVVTWGHLLIAEPFDLCGGLATMAATVLDEERARVINTVPGTADRPDLAAADGRFHAVWQDARPPGPITVIHATDLAGAGGDGWVERGRPTAGVPGSQAAMPSIAADRFAVELAYLDTTDDTIRFLRSIDDGAGWDPGPGLTGLVSDLGAQPLTGPVIASSPANSGAWVAVVWADGGTTSGLAADARFLGEPQLDWDVDEVLGPTRPGERTDAGVLIAHGNVLDFTAYLAWQSEGELLLRTGAFAVSAENPTDFDHNAFLHQGDGPSLRLTACSVDRSTGECVPVPRTGGASQIAMSGDAGPTSYVLLVWRDDREGTGNVFFKRSDRYNPLSSPVPALTSECSIAGAPRIVAEWMHDSTCGTHLSEIEPSGTFLVYHGLDPNGPYLNAEDPVEVAFDLDTTGYRATIERVQAGITHRVFIVTEDEARNRTPSNFDPASDNGPLAGERSVVGATGCVPVCLYTVAIAVLEDLDPTLVFQSPDRNGLSLVADPAVCVFEPGTALAGEAQAGAAITFYQLDLPVSDLRLAREGRDLRFSYAGFEAGAGHAR